MIRLPARLLALLLGCVLLAGQAWGQLAVPALTGHVIDTTGTLSGSARDQLEAKLTAFEQAQGSQLVVLLVGTTQPEDIAAYANRVANTWQIGRHEVGDGLLLLVALQDHRIRIEVAKALEGAIPDLAARRVIDEAISPRFKQGDYAGGLDAGVDRLTALIRGEGLPTPSRASEDGFDPMQLIVFLVIAVPLIGTVGKRLLGPRLGSAVTGSVAGLIAWRLSASLLIALGSALVGLLFTLLSRPSPSGGPQGPWSPGGGLGGGGFGGSGGGGFSSGGGGFSAGGGGDFGGGGASGDW